MVTEDGIDKADEAISVREVAHDSPGYWDAVDLRRQVLKSPIGLEFDPEELAGEFRFRHLVAETGGGKVVGCLVLIPAAPGGGSFVRMRQVAVEPELQGNGIGAKLVRFSEELAVGSGVIEMVLHAREVARLFYERLGYVTEGEPFLEVGLQHWKMRKRLGG